MNSAFRIILAATALWGGRFRSNAKGNVAIIFGFTSVALAIGVGAGMDLSGAYAARQKLSEAAALTCQYSTRTSVVNTQSSNTAYSQTPTNTFQTYLSTVNTFATKTLTAQHLNAANVTPTGGYFTATSGTSGPTNGVTDMSMTYPTSFLKIIRVTSIPLHAQIKCQPVTSAQQINTGSYVLQEGFETNCSSYCFTQPSGVTGALTNPTTTFGSTPTYTGSGGFSFYVIGYCLEIDAAGVISDSDPEKTHSAELDCDNSNHTAGNSSLSTKVYLPIGNYEIRYFYRARVQYPSYDPYYICGTTAADVSWANDTPGSGQFATATRTNQMNVYLDPATNGGTPPLHTTLDGLQQLAGSNLIDVCVYSYKWIERSISVNVTTAGYYWLSFAADGTSDSYGAQLDNIRVCVVTCPTTQQDDWPDSTPWSTPSSTTQTQALATALAAQWSASPPWGWNTYQSAITTLCQKSSFSACTNITRNGDATVMLDPGFYKLTYQYISLGTFSGAPRTGCIQAPTALDAAAAQTTSATVSYPYSGGLPNYSTKADDDLMGVYLTFPGQTLNPSFGSAVSPTNSLLDSCFYSTGVVTRNIGMQITKAGLYDLSFYALGTASSKYLGGAVGTSSSIKITPLGSPFNTGTSTTCPAVPVPDPQVGVYQTPTTAGSGFTFASTDPFLQGASATACTPN